MFKYKKYFIISIILALISVLIFSLSYISDRNDCLDEHPDILSNPTYNATFHKDTIPFGATFVFGAVIPFVSMTANGLNVNHLFPLAVSPSIYYIIGTGIGNGVVNIIKDRLCSPRPIAITLINNNNNEAFKSTPSGHTFQTVYTSVFLFMVICLVYKRKSVLFYTTTALIFSFYPLAVGNTRITDNHHWPVDVLLGAVIGLFIGLAYGLISNEQSETIIEILNQEEMRKNTITVSIPIIGNDMTIV